MRSGSKIASLPLFLDGVHALDTDGQGQMVHASRVYRTAGSTVMKLTPE